MPNKNHVTYLDSIRGLAALTVITEHYVIDLVLI
jgi:peptidoglycan/LPS O-acetylase OafA/YrhL